jgi:hypothetical protein
MVAKKTALVAIQSIGHVPVASRTESLNTSSFVKSCRVVHFEYSPVPLLDSVSFLHSETITDHAVETAVELLFDLDYSPWLDPFKGVFSVCKRHFGARRSLEESFASAKPKDSVRHEESRNL